MVSLIKVVAACSVVSVHCAVPGAGRTKSSSVQYSQQTLPELQKALDIARVNNDYEEAQRVQKHMAHVSNLVGAAKRKSTLTGGLDSSASGSTDFENLANHINNKSDEFISRSKSHRESTLLKEAFKPPPKEWEWTIEQASKSLFGATEWKFHSTQPVAPDDTFAQDPSKIGNYRRENGTPRLKMKMTDKFRATCYSRLFEDEQKVKVQKGTYEDPENGGVHEFRKSMKGRVVGTDEATRTHTVEVKSPRGENGKLHITARGSKLYERPTGDQLDMSGSMDDQGAWSSSVANTSSGDPSLRE